MSVPIPLNHCAPAKLALTKSSCCKTAGVWFSFLFVCLIDFFSLQLNCIHIQTGQNVFNFNEVVFTFKKKIIALYDWCWGYYTAVSQLQAYFCRIGRLPKSEYCHHGNSMGSKCAWIIVTTSLLEGYTPYCIFLNPQYSYSGLGNSDWKVSIIEGHLEFGHLWSKGGRK